MTPEGRIKKMVNKYLSYLRNPLDDTEIYVEMPVPTGYGKSGLDYTICLWGHFVAIETKAPKEWLTPRQRETALKIYQAGGSVFVISSEEGLEAFKRFVEKCREGFARHAGN